MKELEDGNVVHDITVSKSVLQKKSVLIATPMFGGNCSYVHVSSLVKLTCALQQWEIPFTYMPLWNDALITRARNRLTVEFLNSEHTHILFLDADIGFEAGDMLVMLAANKDVIAAPYPLKRTNWEKVRRAAEAGRSAEELESIGSSDFVLNYNSVDFDPNCLTSVSEAGTGCMLISRMVFSDMMNFYGNNLAYKPMDGEPSYQRMGWSFFNCGKDESGYYQSEDYSFCRLWRKLGGAIWLCPWITLSHIGSVRFTGSMKFSFLEGSRVNCFAKDKV